MEEKGIKRISKQLGVKWEGKGYKEHKRFQAPGPRRRITGQRWSRRLATTFRPWPGAGGVAARGCSWGQRRGDLGPAPRAWRGRRCRCLVQAHRRKGLDLSYFNLVTHLTPACPNVYSISRFHHTTPDSKTHSGEKYTDPFKLGWRDLKGLYEDIRKELLISTSELKEMSEYYFDGKGKAFRPIIVALMARACNIHHNNSRHVQASQRTIALIAEMIHTASLVHDDVIDDASSRIEKHTVRSEVKRRLFLLEI